MKTIVMILLLTTCISGYASLGLVVSRNNDNTIKRYMFTTGESTPNKAIQLAKQIMSFLGEGNFIAFKDRIGNCGHDINFGFAVLVTASNKDNHRIMTIGIGGSKKSYGKALKNAIKHMKQLFPNWEINSNPYQIITRTRL